VTTNDKDFAMRAAWRWEPTSSEKRNELASIIREEYAAEKVDVEGASEALYSLVLECFNFGVTSAYEKTCDEDKWKLGVRTILAAALSGVTVQDDKVKKLVEVVETMLIMEKSGCSLNMIDKAWDNLRAALSEVKQK
jgi:hypothetical protein